MGFLDGEMRIRRDKNECHRFAKRSSKTLIKLRLS